MEKNLEFLVNADENQMTKNGMPTNLTSLNYNLDLFFLAGASRSMSDDEIEKIFDKAFNENPLISLKVLFWARDVRGGIGERRFFRVCLNYLRKNHSDVLLKNIKNIPEYGRYDDLTYLLSEGDNDDVDLKVLTHIKETLES